jgi:hypothetical protein
MSDRTPPRNRPITRTLAAIGGGRSRRLHRLALAAALLVLASAPAARADVGATIIERCTHGESLAGFSQQDYARALQELPREVEQYTDCANLIRQAAQLAQTQQAPTQQAPTQQAPIVKILGPTPLRPTVKVIKVQLSHNVLLVTVELSQKGTVRISGTGLRTTFKKNLAAGSHRIRVPLTPSGVAARKHHRKLIVHVALTVAGTASL